MTPMEKFDEIMSIAGNRKQIHLIEDVLLTHVLAFATAAHKAVGQKRKYSGEDYIVHPLEVAQLLVTHAKDFSTPMIAAALLHDVVEDTQVEISDIDYYFGPAVSGLVDWLTDVSKPEDGNRETRKALDRSHTHQASYEAQTIKVCDLIANCLDITKADKDFAVVYMKEKRLLLEGMKADPNLMAIAWKLIEDFEYDQYVLKHGVPPTDGI